MIRGKVKLEKLPKLKKSSEVDGRGVRLAQLPRLTKSSEVGGVAL
jgi:hypothetical protein